MMISRLKFHKYLCYPMLTATLITAMVVCCMPSRAKEDTIVLRLEDQQSPHEKSFGADAETSLLIDVPRCGPPPTAAPNLTALSAVLMDAETGQVLYSKNPHLRLPNASTTKILAAIVVIENCGMSQTVTVSKNASETPFTSLHLKPGEQVSVKDLLMGMMVRSANDAAVALAEHVAGSTTKFAAIMNKRAKELGCVNTHFVTPNGLPAKEHYSSAYDLCLIARHAIKYPVFNEIVNTRKHILSTRTVNREDLAVFARSKFLKNYAGADGIKSGYLKQAGLCFVGSATRDGWRLLSAVLKSKDASQDTAALMDWGFDGFRPFVVAHAGQVCGHAPVARGRLAVVPAAPKKDLKVIVPKSGANIEITFNFKPLQAPVEKGAKIGTMTATINGEKAVSVELQSTQSVGVSILSIIWSWTKIGGLAMLCIIVGRRYGNAFAKGSRRRGHRVAAVLREFDRFR